MCIYIYVYDTYTDAHIFVNDVYVYIYNHYVHMRTYLNHHHIRPPTRRM